MPRPDGSVYVGRLSKSTRTKDLEDIFEPYGRLARCDIKYAYAFIDFEDRRDAEDCVKYENGRELNGQTITVEWAKGGKDRRLGLDECFRCRRTGHWARDCPDLRYGRRGGGGGGYGGGGGGYGGSGYGGSRRRSPSPRRRRSRSRDRKRRSSSRSHDRNKRSRSRERRRSRSRSNERKRSRSRSGSRRSRSESDDRKKESRPKNGSRDRKSNSSGSKSRSRSKSRSHSKSPRQPLENRTEQQFNGDSSKVDRDIGGGRDSDDEDDKRRSRSISRD